MNAARLLDTFLELVRIDSPSLREAELAAYCQRVLEQAGCTVRFDDSAARTGSNTGNLIALLPARRAVGQGDGASVPFCPLGQNGTLAPSPCPTLAPSPCSTAPSPLSRLYFSAHMDTVSPGEGIEPVIVDGIIRSAGSTILGGDDKAGIAAILELVRTLAEGDEPHPEIGVLFSVGEEIGLRGAHAMDEGLFNGEPCFVLDADGSPGVVVIGAPFHRIFTATFSGRAAHAGIEPEKGVSAIVLASQAVLAMRLGRLDERTTANVGSISGGNATNIVPDSCVVRGEFRAMDERRVDEVKAQLVSAIADAVRDTGGSVEVDWEEEYPGFGVSEDSPLVQLVLGEARRLGLPAQATVSGGGSDANVFAGKGARPLVLGIGMTDVHGPDESLAVVDLEDLTRLCIAVACAYGAD